MSIYLRIFVVFASSLFAFCGRQAKAQKVTEVTKLILVPAVAIHKVTQPIKVSSLRGLLKHMNGCVSVKAYSQIVASHKSSFKMRKNSQQLDEPCLYLLSEISNQHKLISVNNKYFSSEHYNFFLLLTKNKEKIKQDLKKILFRFANTGVTALTRGIINVTSRYNNSSWPSLKISSFLKKFDLTQTSNEVSFVDNCIMKKKTYRFCSPWKLKSNLLDIGTDIVGLTGNHNNDFGRIWNKATIDWYHSNNIATYGGGENLKQAASVLYRKVKNTTIALIGFNFANTVFKWKQGLATEKSAGANIWSLSRLQSSILQARKKADVVIVDIQFIECNSYKPGNNYDCYFPYAKPSQKSIFRKAIDCGADIVIGSHAHHPQIIESYKKKIIFYGLGNFLFDQLRWKGTREGMVLEHLFIAGKHINTIVHPTWMNNQMQVTLTSGQRSKDLLKLLYQAR